MEEDIKHLEKRIELNRQMYLEFGRLLSLDEDTVNAIENLINKNKEQQKVIEMMAKFINNIPAVEDICKVVGEKPYCDKYHNSNNCIKCIIDYFRKKAKGE